MSGVRSSTRPERVDGSDAGRDRWWLVAAAGLLIFLAQFDTFVVTTALPTMQADLGFGTGSAQWVLLGFLLPMIAVSLPAGRWLDRVGDRPALMLAVTGFALSSVVAGLATNLGGLIAARMLQGTFAAVMIAQAFSLATTAVRPAARGRSMAVVATLGPLGAVCGPTAGGFLTQVAGWPWIFFVNVPVSLLVLALAWTQAPAGRPLRWPDRNALYETATLGAATALLVLGLSLSTSLGVGWLALSALALPFTAAWRRLPTSRPVLGLVRQPGMAALHVAMLAVFASFLLVQFLVPFHLQREWHASAATVGAILLALPAGQLVLGPLGGVLTDRWGARPTALLGLAGLVAGIVLVVPLGPGWTAADLFWRLAIMGIGLGLSLGPSQAMAMERSPAGLLGTTSASINLARQLGIALGPAVATVLWAASGYSVAGMRLGLGLAAALAVVGALALARRSSADSGPHSSGEPAG